MKKVCIAISTYGNRISSLMLPDSLEEVCYIIVHQKKGTVQFSAQVMSFLNRDDVDYICLDSVGLSKSRNVAIQSANGEYVHIMDDDVAIDPLAIKKMAEFAAQDKVDIALGRFLYKNGRLSKTRNRARHVDVRDFFGVCSIEMCIRKKALDKGIFFDENFGLGSGNPSGEELIFLMDAKRRGLSIGYYPLFVGIHPDVLSGDSFFETKEKIYAKKNMFHRAFPHFCFLLKLAFFFKKIPILLKRKKTLKFFMYFFG